MMNGGADKKRERDGTIFPSRSRGRDAVQGFFPAGRSWASRMQEGCAAGPPALRLPLHLQPSRHILNIIGADTLHILQFLLGEVAVCEPLYIGL